MELIHSFFFKIQFIMFSYISETFSIFQMNLLSHAFFTMHWIFEVITLGSEPFKISVIPSKSILII